jgi:hypothetical protein
MMMASNNNLITKGVLLMKEYDELTTYVLQHEIGFYYDNQDII